MQSTFGSTATHLDRIALPAKSLRASPANGERRAFQCPDVRCGRRFNRKYTLTEHIKTHTGERPHVCRAPRCGKRFSTSGNLSRHMRLHGAIEPVKCPVEGCTCSFLSDAKLAKHMKIHSTPRAHTCKVTGCGKSFSTTGNLNRHLKNQHSQAERDQAGVSTPQVSLSAALCSTPTSQFCSQATRESPRGIDQGWASDTWALSASGSEADSDSEMEFMPSPFREACTKPWSPEMLEILGRMLLD